MKVRKSSKKDTLKDTAGEENARHRGRPRIEPADQSAAERRRTQIRLAQRAYRQRKESTISGLSTRVLSLEQTIEDMSKVFQDFNEKAIESQTLSDPLADILKDSLERFVELASNGVHESAESDEGEDERGRAPDILSRRSARPEEQVTRQEQEAPEGEPMSILGYHAIYDEPGEDVSLTDARGYEDLDNTDWVPAPIPHFDAEYQEMSRREPGSTTGSQQLLENVDQKPEPGSENRDVEQYRALIPEPYEEPKNIDPKPRNLSVISITHPSKDQAQALSSLLVAKELPLPQSYSFYETFARRLIRFAYESFLTLTDPAQIDSICNFTFCFSNSSDMRKAILSLLGRSTHDNLEHWKDIPQYHLGGAGLHFPRAGIDASSSPPPDWHQSTTIGSRPLLKAEKPMPNTMTTAEIVQHLGYDGEWYDANDVEQYLRTKGLYLDELSRIVEFKEPDEAYVPTLDLGSGQSQEICGGWTVGSPLSSRDDLSAPGSPENNMRSLFAEEADNDYFWSQESMRMPSLSGGMAGINMDVDFSYGQASGKTFEPVFDPTVFQGQMPTFNPKAKKFMDVEKFLDTMLQSSVCLGRTPGFRRSAIDAALNTAIIQEYDGLDELVVA